MKSSKLVVNSKCENRKVQSYQCFLELVHTLPWQTNSIFTILYNLLLPVLITFPRFQMDVGFCVRHCSADALSGHAPIMEAVRLFYHIPAANSTVTEYFQNYALRFAGMPVRQTAFGPPAGIANGKIPGEFRSWGKEFSGDPGRHRCRLNSNGAEGFPSAACV